MLLEPVLGARFRDISFDSRDIFFNGGIDKDDETITFKSQHNLENGEKVFYRNGGNPSLGIETHMMLVTQLLAHFLMVIHILLEL